MRKLTPANLVLLAAFAGASASVATADDYDRVALLEAAIASITADELREHTGLLADDTLEGREAGKRGGVAAAFDFVGADATLALAFGATRKRGRVVQVGLAGGEARLKAITTWPPEVQFSYSWWGNIKELREVLAMAEDGRLTPIALAFEPLERINQVHDRLESGKAEGRLVVTP